MKLTRLAVNDSKLARLVYLDGGGGREGHIAELDLNSLSSLGWRKWSKRTDKE